MLINNANCTSDNFLRPVKIEPEKISLEEIHSIGKDFSFRYPNFYFYEKEHIVPGWLLITGNFLLKIFHSRQPVWRLLIIIKNFKKVMGMSYLKRRIYTRKKKSIRIKTIKGFTLVRNK
jgi:hypothetical protein